MDPYNFYDQNKNNNDPQSFNAYTDDPYWDSGYANAPGTDDQYGEERPRRSKKKEISGIRVALGSVCMILSFAMLLFMNGTLKLEWPTGGIPEIRIISAGGEDGAVYEATGSAVNIRSGPGMEYDAFSRAMQGEMLSATGQISSDGAWIEVICPENGELGWASADYMRKLT